MLLIGKMPAIAKSQVEAKYIICFFKFQKTQSAREKCRFDRQFFYFYLAIIILYFKMNATRLRVSKLPTTEASLTNKVYINQRDLDASLTRSDKKN
jgi:hypothetical protein